MTGLFEALAGEAALPGHVDIAGAAYPIVTDFRYWMRAESYFFDGEKANEDRLTYLLMALLPSFEAGVLDAGGYPFAVDEAIRALLLFYTCGRPQEEKAGGGRAPSGGKRERSYDFLHDFALIYAAFQAVYGMDLRGERMHWWRFQALFAGLPPEAGIRTLMEARTRPLEKPTPAQRTHREALALPERIRYIQPSQGGPADLDSWAKSIQQSRAASRAATEGANGT